MKIIKYLYMVFLIGLVIWSFYINFNNDDYYNFKIWDEAYDELNVSESYTLKEEVELSYTIDNKENKRILTVNKDLQMTPFIQKNIYYTVKDGVIDLVPKTAYFIEEEERLFYIHKKDEYLIKSELDQYHRYENQTIDPYYFILNHIPVKMKQITESKQEFNYHFKLNQYKEEYQHIFDEIINQLREEFSINEEINVIDQELVLTIRFDEKNKKFESFMIDLTPIFSEMITKSTISHAKNVNLKVKYTFSNYNTVNINEFEYDQAIYDDAPNEMDLSYLFPIYELGNEVQGNFEYGEDIDIYDMYIDFEGEVNFHISSQADYRIYLVDEEDHRINFINNVFLKPGYYYVVVENKTTQSAPYTIKTTIKNDIPTEVVIK